MFECFSEPSNYNDGTRDQIMKLIQQSLTRLETPFPSPHRQTESI